MMKYTYLLLFVSLLAFYACDKSDKDDIPERYDALWNPGLRNTTINDKTVSIHWDSFSGQEGLYTKCLMPSYKKPEKYELYKSDSQDGTYTKVFEYDETGKDMSYTATNLPNDKPVYFYLKSLCKGYEDAYSEKVMLIPNPRPKTEIILANEKNKYNGPTFSPGLEQVAYFQHDGSYNFTPFSIAQVTGTTDEVIETIAGTDPYWSADGSRIVYKSTDYYTVPGVGIYDCATKESTYIPNQKDFIDKPIISDDNRYILYIASSMSGIYYQHIRLVDLETKKDSIIFKDIQDKDIDAIHQLCWVDNETFLFSGYASIIQTSLRDDYNRSANDLIYPFRSQIFKMSLKDEGLQQILNSIWEDRCPAISPDKKQLAFISYRSGDAQVWYYNMETKQLRQLTGYEKNEGPYQMSISLRWIDNKTIYYSLNSDTVYKLTI